MAKARPGEAVAPLLRRIREEIRDRDREIPKADWGLTLAPPIPGRTCFTPSEASKNQAPMTEIVLESEELGQQASLGSR